MDALQHYLWPGNVRELRNMVERAMILSNGSTLVVDVPDSAAPAHPGSINDRGGADPYCVRLERTGWRIRGKKGAAELLELKPTTLDSKMKKLGITRNPPYSEISCYSEIS